MTRPGERLGRRSRLVGGIGLILVVAAGCAAFGQPPGPGASATAQPMQLIAHRGDVTSHPENSLDALVAAAELGADGIELDVQRSRDGTWWVIHDRTVDRTTTGSGWVRDISDAKMAALRIDGGAGYDAAVHGRRLLVPTLAQALDALADYQGLLYLDVKELEAGGHGAAARYVDELGLSERTTILCELIEGAAEVKLVQPEIRTLVMTPGDVPPDQLPAHVDGWLGNAAVVIREGYALERPYDVELFADLVVPLDERLVFEERYVLPTRALITNDVRRAQELLAELAATDR